MVQVFEWGSGTTGDPSGASTSGSTELEERKRRYGKPAGFRTRGLEEMGGPRRSLGGVWRRRTVREVLKEQILATEIRAVMLKTKQRK